MKRYVRVPRHLGKFNDVLRLLDDKKRYIKTRLQFAHEARIIPDMKGYVRVPRHLGKFNDVLRRWTINEVYIKIRLHFKKGT